MEYQVSWGIGGDTLLMPSQKDVIRGHIQRYLTANKREHDAISDETIVVQPFILPNSLVLKIMSLLPCSIDISASNGG